MTDTILINDLLWAAFGLQAVALVVVTGKLLMESISKRERKER